MAADYLFIGLAHPACRNSILTSANKKDHASMGTALMRQTQVILKNVEHVIAIKLLCTCQAYNLICQKTLKAGKGTRAVYDTIRARIPFLNKNRELYVDINAVVDMIHSCEIIKNVEAAVGESKGY